METINIYNPTQIKEIEEQAIKEYNFTQDILMENAAHAILTTVVKYYNNYKIHILCGPGNNGGDGMAAARLLYNNGWDVKISYLNPPNYQEASQLNYLRAKNIPVCSFKEIDFSKKTLIIDSLFGIGLNRSLDEKTKELVLQINNSSAPVLSVDIPTGVNALTGKILDNNAIKADMTITFIGQKTGQILFPGADNCGKVIISSLSLPKTLLSNKKLTINTPVPIKRKSRNSHKCSNGKILTVAGSLNYYGAPYFSSKAALLVGAGFSTLITPESIARVCATLAPEVIYREDKYLSDSILTASSTVFGPGLGVNSRSRKLFTETIKALPDNLIIDADGLNILSENLEILNGYTKPFVITPHLGEMSRLIGKSIKDIENNRIHYAESLAKDINAIVILKGVFTVIATPKGQTYINKTSSVTLATAGSGDILSGIISGLAGYNNLLTACRAAVYIHGLAGILAEGKIGVYGVTAKNILEYIPNAVNLYIKGINNYEQINY